MAIIGLTGGIGSGKTTVARLLAEHGATIVDTDVLAREALAPGEPGHQAVLDRFGEELLESSGAINRSELAKLVFANESARADLEAIVHPVVAQVVHARIATADPAGVLVLEVPLLIDANGKSRYEVDGVLVVDAPEDIALERLVMDRNMDPTDAQQRISAQIPRPKRLAAADFVILNIGTMEELTEMVDRAWDWIVGLKNSC